MANDHKLGGLGHMFLVHSSAEQVGMTGAPSRVSQGKNEGVGRLGSHLEALEESAPWPNWYWQN